MKHNERIPTGLPPDVYRKRLMAKIRANVEIDPDTGCWLWQGYIHPNGYGHIGVGLKQWRVHRLSLTLSVRPLEKDELACHTCDVRRCCNPDHLYIGNKHINAVDQVASGTNFYAKRTHCRHGHEFTPENTSIPWRANGRIGRVCRTCVRNQQRRKAGWTEEQIASIGRVPMGYRPVNGRYSRAAPPASLKEGEK